MSKPLRLSHSAVTTHSQCSEKYRLHYLERLRPIKQGSALVFGSAMDLALNALIVNKDLKEANAIFDKNMHFANINGQEVYVPTHINITYSEKDFDHELLLPEDVKKFFETYQLGNNNKEDLVKFYKEILAAKKSKHFEYLEGDVKQVYAFANWLSVRRKGLILLQSYHDQILPKIKEVLAIQKTINLENDQGDTVIGYLDLAAIWEDGKRYILDNKTASREYEPDAVKASQQLALYYHAEKDELKLDGAGFIVMLKDINKNRTKICSVCGFDGSKGRYKTCPEQIPISDSGDYIRCDGDWIETIRPEGRIQVILDTVLPEAEDFVIDTFDAANEGIKAGIFEKNESACFNPFPCPYYRHCFKGDSSGLVQLPEKETK